MQNKKRTFIAIDIPEEIKDHIQRYQIGLPKAKWVRKENLHLTLLFLGEINLQDFEFLRQILNKVEKKKFSMYLKQPNVFFKKQKILWLKAEPNNEIVDLKNKIYSLLSIHGFFKIYPIKNKNQEFVPHITIARMDVVDTKKLNDYLLTFSDFVSDEFEVNTFILYSSKLLKDGPIYTKEEEYYLK